MRLLTLNHNFHLSSVDTAIVHWDFDLYKNTVFRRSDARLADGSISFFLIQNAVFLSSSVPCINMASLHLRFYMMSAQNCLMCVLNVET